VKLASPHPTTQRVLVLVDESNVTSSAKTTNRKLDWLKLRDFLVKGRELIEMVVYSGLPPSDEGLAGRTRQEKRVSAMASLWQIVDPSIQAETHCNAFESSPVGAT
jgi:hypothetical protein